MLSKQLAATKAQTSQAEVLYNEQIDALDDIYDQAKDQYNALLGIDDSVLSVSGAITELNGSMVDYQDSVMALADAQLAAQDTYALELSTADYYEASLDFLSEMASNIKRLRALQESQEIV